MAKNKVKAPKNSGSDENMDAGADAGSINSTETQRGTETPGGEASPEATGTSDTAEVAGGTALRSRKRDLGTPSETFNLVTFLKGTKEELDKVVWPTRQQLISESAAVLLMVSLSATVVYLVDNVFSWAARQVFG